MRARLRVVVVPMVLLAVACGGQGSGASQSSSDVTQRLVPTSAVVPRQAATAAAPSRTEPEAVPPTTTSTAARPPIATSTASSVVPPAVVATSEPPAGVGTPALAPARGPTDPWLVAVRTDGGAELWAATGKVGSFQACAPALLGGCLVDVAVSDSAAWLVRYDGDGHRDLLRASRVDGHVQTLSFEDLLPGATDVRSIAVSADDRTLWFVAAAGDLLGRAKLYMRDHAGTRPVRPDLVAIDVALSRDGRRLAYSGYRDPGHGSYPSHAVLVVREVATGVERTLALEAQAETPVAPYSLAWSRDGHHLAFDFGWEGGVPEVVDVDAAATLDDALPLPGIEPEVWQSVPMCWTGPDNLAVGRWRSGVEGPYVPGDLDDLDVVTGRYRPRGLHLFSFGMICRDDGAVAVRPDVGSNDAGPLPTDLVVIRPDGSTTVLGRGYTQIVAP